MEISNLSDREFKAMVLKTLIELRRRMDEHGNNFNKETGNIGKNETEVTELKNIIAELKNMLVGINS